MALRALKQGIRYAFVNAHTGSCTECRLWGTRGETAAAVWGLDQGGESTKWVCRYSVAAPPTALSSKCPDGATGHLPTSYGCGAWINEMYA